METTFKYLIWVKFKRYCSCGSNYVSKTITNSKTRFNECEKLSKKSNQNMPNHFTNNNKHKFSWTILTRGSFKLFKKKNPKTRFIKHLNLSLNNQLNNDRVILSQGVSQAWNISSYVVFQIQCCEVFSQLMKEIKFLLGISKYKFKTNEWIKKNKNKMSLKIPCFLTYFLFLSLPTIDWSHNYNFKTDRVTIYKT